VYLVAGGVSALSHVGIPVNAVVRVCDDRVGGFRKVVKEQGEACDGTEEEKAT
jgi:hypothetical protein